MAHVPRRRGGVCARRGAAAALVVVLATIVAAVATFRPAAALPAHLPEWAPRPQLQPRGGDGDGPSPAAPSGGGGGSDDAPSDGGGAASGGATSNGGNGGASHPSGGGGAGGGAAGGAHGPTCEGGPAFLDDLPEGATSSLNRYTPAFLALADMAYARDPGSGAPRRSIGPCLGAWGARGAVAEVGGGLAYVFRTRRDVFVAIRGMDGAQGFPHYATRVAPVFDPLWFGAPPLPRAPPPRLPAEAYRTRRPFADPDLFWVLQRDYEDARRLDGPLTDAVSEQLAQMDAPARASARVWLTGHSSGGALAQLMALRLAAALGPGRVGGAALFNSDRAGSAAFAAHYDAILGNRTMRYGYGLDNANMAANMAMGLRFPGRAFWACPVPGAAAEALVTLAPGADRVNMCKGLTPWPRADDLETKDDVAARWRMPFLGRYPVMSTIAEWSSFSHHFPPLLFDSLLRVLGPRLDACAAHALALPQCFVSEHCAAALRPPGRRCRSCASHATCTDLWGLKGHRCDAWPSIWRSGLCYPRVPFGVPPTLLGLFWGHSSPAPPSPPAPQAGCAGAGQAAVGAGQPQQPAAAEAMPTQRGGGDSGGDGGRPAAA